MEYNPNITIDLAHLGVSDEDYRRLMERLLDKNCKPLSEEILDLMIRSVKPQDDEGLKTP